MPSIDRAVWVRLNQRFTRGDIARLEAVERSHELKNCPFVDAVKRLSDAELARTYVESYVQLARAAKDILAAPFDAGAFVGEETRFTASFRNPLGAQSVARGEDPQNVNGGRRIWASVSGEIETR